MCGITGIVQLHSDRPVDHRALALMTRSLHHRGPDDEGLYTSPVQACALGVRRLSIIDLAGGHQPLSNEDGTCWVVQNGEIYNYKPLRAQLEALGHIFRTQSDTEVIVHAYEAWGEAFVERLWGMFALALWDEARQRLVLARDRFGIKPLFHAEFGGFLLFASEIKALLRFPGFLPSLDPRSLEDMFTIGFIPGPATIWQSVHKLAPAHGMVVHARQGTQKPWRYWKPSLAQEKQGTLIHVDEAAEQVLFLLRDAVRLRLQSDVPVGALLSGGIDSSSIVALMQELSGGRTHTFSIGFAQDSHDERDHALRAADHLGTQHHVLSFDWDAFDLLPEVVSSLDQPQCFATAVPIWLLYRACHETGLKVILTGEGSDELFAGYHWLWGNQLATPFLALPVSLRRAIFHPGWPWPMSPGAQRVLASADTTPIGRYLAWLQVSLRQQRADLFTADLQAMLNSSQRLSLVEDWQERYGGEVAGLSSLSQDLTLERQQRLPNFINHEVDAMSMAHSVEARVPFLDHRLWELLGRWPSELKLPSRWAVPSRGREKGLLRAALAQPNASSGRPYLPDSIRLRPKQGLAAPHRDWWRRPAMPPWVDELLSPEALSDAGLFVPATVERWRKQHQAGQGEFGALLTGVLNTQLWWVNRAGR